MPPSKKNSKPVILVTIPPYAYLVNEIAGDLVATEILVPAGANPHIYEPTPKQVEQFARAQIWFRLGDPAEEKILPFLRERNVQDVDLTKGMKLLSSDEHQCHEGHTHESKDRHVWLDPILTMVQAHSILDNLSAVFPEHKEEFQNNYEQLIQKLEQLDEELAQRLMPYQNSYLLLSHPALGYFCARYGLHQISVECDGKDPRPQQAAQIVYDAAEKDVKMVLIEPQYNNKGATLIAEKLELPIYQIDPYAEDYCEMMRHLTQLIVQNYDH